MEKEERAGEEQREEGNKGASVCCDCPRRLRGISLVGVEPGEERRRWYLCEEKEERKIAATCRKAGGSGRKSRKFLHVGSRTAIKPFPHEVYCRLSGDGLAEKEGNRDGRKEERDSVGEQCAKKLSSTMRTRATFRAWLLPRWNRRSRAAGHPLLELVERRELNEREERRNERTDWNLGIY